MWKGGLVYAAWKCVGSLSAHFIVKHDSLNDLDDVFFKLPLFVHNGENMIAKLVPIKEGGLLANKLRELTKIDTGPHGI